MVDAGLWEACLENSCEYAAVASRRLVGDVALPVKSISANFLWALLATGSKMW